MAITSPYRRTARPLISGSYLDERYMRHPDYALSPEHYIRGFKILQNDFLSLLDYIEPADININCYSFRIHALFIRICIEIEANLAAVLIENRYSTARDKLSMLDYRRINDSHKLSEYIVDLPVWSGHNKTIRPFIEWRDNSKRIDWYQAYNRSKHDRHNAFEDACFGNLVKAMCGLVALISSQFWTCDLTYRGAPALLISDRHTHDVEIAIGGYFRVFFPDFADQDKYDFSWEALASTANPIQSLF